MEEMEAWVARDEDGELYLFREKPIKDKFVWYPPYGFSLAILSTLLPEVQWSDDEPTRVKITIEE